MQYTTLNIYRLLVFLVCSNNIAIVRDHSLSRKIIMVISLKRTKIHNYCKILIESHIGLCFVEYDELEDTHA